MKRLLVILCVLMFSFSGCKDISGSTTANFGTTAKDKEAIDYINNNYGDLTGSGEYRILEEMLTTNVVDYFPVDKVVKYSKDIDMFYIWFVYDNFKAGDQIDIIWTYDETSVEIGRNTVEAGGDFGRSSFSLKRPGNEWPLGMYTVLVEGQETSAEISFEVIDGETVSGPVPFADYKSGVTTTTLEVMNEPETKPGWYLITVEDYGDKIVSTHDYYSYDVEYVRGEIVTSNIGDKGETAIVKTTWEQPKDFYAAGEEIAIKVKKEAVMMATADLGLGDTSIIGIDMADVAVDRGTSSAYRLEDETFGGFFKMDWSDSTGDIKEGVFKANVPKENAFGGSFRVLFSFQNGVSYRANYIYEWKE